MSAPDDRPAPEGTFLDKAYDPHAIEKRLYDAWEQAGYFKPSGTGPAYCIMIPPPNVTGSLHMGHAFNNTIMDALTRWHRMRGDNTLWQPGTDHAGIATQMVVERQLNAEGKTRHDLGREKFIERVWTWKAESGGNISRQLRRLGSSVDWSRERFTMDPEMSKAVTEVFVRLFDEGLIYRGKRLVNWDPVLHTAVSDLEVVSEEEQGSMWHIRYPIADSPTKRHLIVATTRPETMLGDSAVAVHPDDGRYRNLIGNFIELPLTGRLIPIIADEYVDPEFGSGCVKITPAHDFNDYEVGKRNNLPLINIFTPDARICETSERWLPPTNKMGSATVIPAGPPGPQRPQLNELPSAYRGLDRFEARKKIVADLEAAGLIEKIEPHKLMVPRGDRSGAVVEPYLTDQWYVRVAPLAAEAIKVVEDGRIKFVPENWSKTYYEWMRNIQDWCISRQIWWGHRIPAWYDKDGHAYVARTEDEARIKFEKRLKDFYEKERNKYPRDTPIWQEFDDKLHELRAAGLTQDQDVLDTWFSSALWPFSTLGWPKQTPELKAFYPTSVLVTGFDIIFFWVARMVMMGTKFMGEVPFKEVYIHGLVRDAHGHKMSKSKGNVLDPIDLIDGIDLEALVKKRTSGLMQPQMAKKIEQATRKEFPAGIPAFGTDALRFTFASQATQGRDVKFDLNRIEGYRNFCNKLWNAARYVLMNTEGKDCGQSYEVGAQAPSARLPLPPGEGMRVRESAMTLTAADRWIISRLNETAAEVESAFKEYRFDLAAQALYHFTWNEYCDWYLELSKVVLTDANASAESRLGTRHTLVNVLETLLRLMHPLMPFISEEIWQRVAPMCIDSRVVHTPLPAGEGVGVRAAPPHPLPSPRGRGEVGENLHSGRNEGEGQRTIMLQPYPQTDRNKIDDAASEEMRWVMGVITAVRSTRSGRDISPGKALPVLLADGGARERAWMKQNEHYLKLLARMESLTWLEAGASAPESAMELVGQMKVLIPLGAFIDKQGELARIKKEIEKFEKELVKARGKLANADFVARAPAAVVEQEKGRIAEFEAALAKLAAQREQVAALPG